MLFYFFSQVVFALDPTSNNTGKESGVYQFTAFNNWPVGFNKNKIKSLNVDAEGTLWIGTEDTGLWRETKKSDGSYSISRFNLTNDFI